MNVFQTDEACDVTDLQTGLQKLVRKRATCKTKVTKYFTKLETLTESSFNVHKDVIENLLNDVTIVDEEILNYFNECDASIIDSTVVDNEVDKQSEYLFSIKVRLNDIKEVVTSDTPVNDLSEGIQFDAPPPPLQCGSFAGEEDELQFRTFLLQFNNVIDSKSSLSNSAKLSYFRGYLKGYALNIISHLEISDNNYDVTINLLKQEFLDIPRIKSQIFSKLLTSSPKFDLTYKETRIYINDVRSLLHELRNFDLDFLAEDTPGNELISHVIFSKLPVSLQREICRKVDSNYPSINSIFLHYSDVVRNLQRAPDKSRVNSSVKREVQQNNAKF